ncbi:MAG: metallophosphoesterase [Negativicutes bacterium]|nr:metallophosphoesterase [Negativicutes bacterium]
MKIFAIADTHLSGNPPAKPMDIFGSHWHNHWNKIKNDWLATVANEDTVLLPGDISWAMKLEDALNDLREIIALPGRKILVRGNHDYWWQTVSKMNKAVDGALTFLHNNFTPVGKYAVCGSRGWVCPDDPHFTPEDAPIYRREIERTRTSLETARKAGFTRIILMLHYPPLYAPDRPSGFTELFAEYNVEICVYGHLHSEAIKQAPVGMINGTLCHLVSCDALDFKLKPII